MLKRTGEAFVAVVAAVCVVPVLLVAAVYYAAVYVVWGADA
jgi:hypothetical protein